jgi:hypothetical protein
MSGGAEHSRAVYAAGSAAAWLRPVQRVRAFRRLSRAVFFTASATGAGPTATPRGLGHQRRPPLHQAGLIFANQAGVFFTTAAADLL